MRGCALAGLAALLAVLCGVADAQPAVAVLADGGWRGTDLADVDPDSAKSIDHLWVWSDAAPPVRVEPADLPFEPEPAAGTFQVRLPPGPRPDWELLAAPEAMWLEVPESLVSRWPVPERGPARLPEGAGAWTLRLLAGEGGSWWHGRPAAGEEVTLTSSPAQDRRLQVLGEDGGPIETGTASLLVGPVGTERHRMVALEVVTEGLLVLPSLPDSEELSLVVTAPGHPPATWRSMPSALPSRIVLPGGNRLRGRFVTADGLLVEGVQVTAEGWAEGDSTAVIRRRTTSGPDGSWSLEALPSGELALEVKKRGFVGVHRIFEITGDGQDLGAIVLRPGVAARVRVVDDLGSPVVGARIEYGGRQELTSDGEGRVVLADLPSTAESTVRLSAPGHLTTEVEVVPQEEELRVVLPRAFVVSGQVLDTGGAPLPDISVVARTGNHTARYEIPPSGGFQLDLEPGVSLSLDFTSPAHQKRTLSVEAGMRGESRDLGVVHLGEGRVVHGRVWSRVDGAPLAGARVWFPHSSREGQALSWMRGELLSTTSDADGLFRLGGLSAAPALLRIDAPRHARGHLRVPAGSAGEPFEAGDVELVAGGTVEVWGGDRDGLSVARVDLRGDWQEMDMLTAPVMDGRARIAHVPPPGGLVTVLAGTELLCEAVVGVKEGEESVIECDDAGVNLSGIVVVGEGPADQGTLSWRLADREAPAGVILNQTSPVGARRQQIMGAGRPPKDIQVDASGFFLARGLSPGTWEVTYLAGTGSYTDTLRIEVPAEDVRGFELRFSGGGVSGVTVDAEGMLLAGVRVRDVVSGGHAISDPEGRFQLIGLAPGTHRVYGRFGELRSEEVLVEVREDRPPEPVLLRLQAGQGRQLRVRVVDGEETPEAGALVLITRENGSFRVLTTDSAGHASHPLEPPEPSRIAVAVLADGRWAFTGWRPWAEQGGVEIIMEEGPPGSIVLRTDDGGGPLRLASSSAGDLTPFLARVGIPMGVRSGAPLHIEGLPPGTYTVAVGPFSRTVAVEAGSDVQVELP